MRPATWPRYVMFWAIWTASGVVPSLLPECAGDPQNRPRLLTEKSHEILSTRSGRCWRVTTPYSTRRCWTPSALAHHPCPFCPCPCDLAVISVSGCCCYCCYSLFAWLSPCVSYLCTSFNCLLPAVRHAFFALTADWALGVKAERKDSAFLPDPLTGVRSRAVSDAHEEMSSSEKI